MWLDFWQMQSNPFPPRGARYCSTPEHERVIDRLICAVDQGAGRIGLTGDEGVGKSMALAEVLRRLKAPRRRLIALDAGGEPAGVLSTAVRRLGGRVAPRAELPLLWQTLRETVKVLNWQGESVLIAIDGCNRPEQSEWLDRWSQVGSGSDRSFTLILAGRDAGSIARLDSNAFKLQRLTRSEAARYLDARFAAVGCDGSIFDPTAVARLHAASAGICRTLDRLAARALELAALRNERGVSAQVVDRAALEDGPSGWYERRRVG